VQDDDLATVVDRERLLLDPAVRADRDRVESLLHPDVVEHGASGRAWTRSQIVAALADDPAVTGHATGFVAVRLSADVVLVTYRVDGPRASLRSSVWVEVPGAGWQLRFHQGTPTD
jgi:ribonuclease HI